MGAVTIESIEGDVWPDPPPDATRLVRTCHALRRVPLTDLTVEDLRLLLGQQVAVPVLLPRALAVLREDPAAAGDLYPGDLARAVLRLPVDAWSDAPGERDALVARLRALGDVDVLRLLADALREPPVRRDRRPRAGR